MNRKPLEPLRPTMLDELPLPWKACRSHEDHDGPLWEIDPEEAPYYAQQPFVRIVASNGNTVVSNHDLFVFKDPAVAHLLAAAPALLRALELASRDYLSPGTRPVVNAALRAARGEA